MFDKQLMQMRKQAPMLFVNSQDELNADVGYQVEESFNVDDSGLFWKRMSARTYIHPEKKKNVYI